MLMLKICHTCDSILGEIDSDALTGEYPTSIIEVVGNVAYALCPDCMRQLEVRAEPKYH